MSAPMSNRRKLVNLILWTAALLALAGFAWIKWMGPQLNTSIANTLGRGDYVLSATDGSTFTQDTLKGAPSAVFFGFTHCPEVCPTTLGDIAAWQAALGPDGEKLRVFFVTVDPERDTPAVLGEYLSWVPGVVGVSGSRAEIDKAIRAFRVYAAKVPLENGDYTMDHSANVMLFDRTGRFYEPIGYQEGNDRAVAKIRRLVAE